ncbi:MAG: DeoR/GlpR family DNA-binding transcription regulator [Alkalispirochaeta sp.]
MTGLERRQTITTILKKRGSLRVTEMSERLGVSEVTLRKDLATLEEMGVLERPHGGAVLADQTDVGGLLSTRKRSASEAKQSIARAARSLLSHGETVYIDSGSTCTELARLVTDMELRVVSNALDILVMLADRPGIALHATGGAFRHHAGSFIGPDAEDVVSRMHFDHAFLGATGVSQDGRCSSQNSIEAQLKRRAIASAATSVILADATKIGRNAFSEFSTMSEIDILITDAAADMNTVAAFRQDGLDVIVAEALPPEPNS